jgi:hypothetical protein
MRITTVRGALALTLAAVLAACGGQAPNPPGAPPTPIPANASSPPATASSPAANPGPVAPRPVGHSACDQGLWSHIYHPYRLHVISACKTVTGTVEGVQQEPDGDLHILLRPDPAYASLINSANTEFEDGDLVLEEICVGVITQADAVAACRNFSPPSVSGVSMGDHVKVTGSYVLDADHGWMEIHPVSQISVVQAPPASSAPASSAPAPAPPAPASCYPKTSSGNCYEPGEFCSKAERGETGVAGDGKTITCTDVSGSWRWES